MNERRWEEGYTTGIVGWENLGEFVPWINDPVTVDGGPATGIPSEDIDALVGMVTGFVAEAIQYYIDAGSERDVIREDDELYLVLSRVFRDWSPDYDKPKGYTLEVT